MSLDATDQGMTLSSRSLYLSFPRAGRTVKGHIAMHSSEVDTGVVGVSTCEHFLFTFILFSQQEYGMTRDEVQKLY